MERAHRHKLLLVALSKGRWICIGNGQTAPSVASGRTGPRRAQLWVILVPSTFRHSRMKAANPVQPLAETMVPST